MLLFRCIMFSLIEPFHIGPNRIGSINIGYSYSALRINCGNKMSTEAVAVLGRKYSVDILRAAREPRSVSWLSQELDIPIATCYRRVKELSENMYLEEVTAD